MKPSAILTADNHLLEKNPICRIDDLTETQWKKQKWLSKLQEKHDCPIIDAGDLFHRWKPSPELLTKAIPSIGKRIVVPGNHDLPAHNINLYYKSGLAVLEKANVIHPINLLHVEYFDFVLDMFPWGSELKPYDGDSDKMKIALCHVFTFPGKKPWPGCTSMRGQGIMRKLKGYDLIVTGDNHQSFALENKKQVLINPGSLCRLTSSQVNHRPCVYLWYAEDNSIEKIYVPIKKNVISRTHIEDVEQRDERLEAFISRLDNDFEVGLSFEKNLKEFMFSNNIPKPVEKIINESVYDC